MKILAYAATNHKDSINRKLVRYAMSILQDSIVPSAQVEFPDLIDYELPLYRQDREAEEGVPAAAQDFYHKIGVADALIISFAEHNGSFSAVYKNLFDWMSRINQKVYQGKPVVLMAASPGPRGGAGVLGTVEMGALHFGMDIKAKISVPYFQDHFDFETGKVTNPEIQRQIESALAEAFTEN